MKIAVCGICRNESTYLEEWIAYYKISGFDSVYVYDNVSDDGTSELLAALDNVGEARRVHWPRREGIPPQRDAYGHFLEHYASDYDYVLICDLDEFLVVENGTVKELLLEAEEKFDDVGAIAFPWRLFGSSGHETASSDLVIERFIKCEERPSPVVKTMFSPKKTYNMRTHICDLLSGTYLDNALKPAEWNQLMPIKLKSPSMGRAVVHHYYTKSRQEWTKRRALPKADRAVLELKNITEFEKYHAQVHEVSCVKDLAPVVKHRMKTTREKLNEVRRKVRSAKIEIMSVNKDWIFGVVTSVNSVTALKVRVLNSEHKETIVQTKPVDKNTHVFIVKTKWRDTFSEKFSISVVGNDTSEVFERSRWPAAEQSIELLVKYTPEAEEHIFSIFLGVLGKEPTPHVIKLMRQLSFTKYTKIKDFMLALESYIKEPKAGHLKRFLETCDTEFVRQVADPDNKRRKYISDALMR